MEMILNVAWLGASATAFVTVLALAGRGKRGRALFAVVAVLALLFPVISLTDDLSAERGGLEDAPALLVAIHASVARLVALGRLQSPEQGSTRSCLVIRTDPRSPPSC